MEDVGGKGFLVSGEQVDGHVRVGLREVLVRGGLRVHARDEEGRVEAGLRDPGEQERVVFAVGTSRAGCVEPVGDAAQKLFLGVLVQG